MLSTSLRLRLLVLGLLLCGLLCAAQEGDQPTYPEEVHRLVVARLRERAGGGPLAGGQHREGSWGAWAPWSPCSRSCGGGVATQSRECVPSKRSRSSLAGKRRAESKRCVGRYKRFQLCNTQTCPGLPRDFRQQQCEAFNRTPFNDRTYAWEPYLESLSSCALNCRAVGLSFYATLNQTVIDGTPCGPPHQQPPSLCVGGQCMTVGCDGILGSGRVSDQCGECGGDNSSCRVLGGSYTRTPALGYSLVVTLPRGAANVSVMQLEPTVANHLALRVPGGEYLLQGGRLGNGSLVSYVEAAGATFGYRRPSSSRGDSLGARGPLLHPLDVMLYSEGSNPGVSYRYQLPPREGARSGGPHYTHYDNPLNPFVPGGPASRAPLTGPVNDARSGGGGFVSDNLVNEEQTGEEKNGEEKRKEEREKKARKAKGRRRQEDEEDEDEEEEERKKKRQRKQRKRGPYEWKVAGFTPCSKTCGGGVQATHVSCVRKRRGAEVPEQNCYAVPRPGPQTVRCNLKPCPPQWGADEWGPCSVSCGLGVQTRPLTCRQTVSDDTDIVVPDTACAGDPATIPRAQVCERPPCGAGPQWEVGEWGDCSVQCGLGTRTRRVTCMAAGSTIPHLHCAQPRPSDQQICDMGSCATNTWFFSPWEDQCSAQCGEGHERRRVHCNGNPLNDRPHCGASSRPNDTRACNSDRGCGGQWFAGSWSPCDARCGGSGQQHRQVMCVTWGRRRYRIAEDDAPCRSSGLPRPETLRICSKPCEDTWFTSQWSQCSASCGGGVQRREVKCLDGQQRPSLQCAAATKPDTRQTCGAQHCGAADGGPEAATMLEGSPRLQSLEGPARDGTRRGYHYSVRADEPPSPAPPLVGGGASEDEETNTVLAAASQPRPARVSAPSGWCMDRMKNCNLVYKARLCRLKYYSKLCCRTCTPGG